MKKYFGLAFLLALFAAAPANAQTPGPSTVPSRVVSKNVTVPALQHVWVIMMENHQYSQVIGSPNTPFLSGLAAQAGTVTAPGDAPVGTWQHPAISSSTAYYGVSHPSLVNYLNFVGGSNFGVNNDTWPNWINGGCVDNEAGGSANCVNAVPPLQGTLTDLAEPATSTTGNGACNAQLAISTSATNNCALYDYPSESVTAQTIADQLVGIGQTWKTYQQSLPTITSAGGVTTHLVDGVNYSDGSYSNLMPASFFIGTDNTGFSNGVGNVSTPRAKGSNLIIPKLYAVKHNPFVYFANIQTGSNPALSEAQVADFDGKGGLYQDLINTTTTPTFSFIAPNQCYDNHKLAGTEDACDEDSQDQLMADAYLKKIVTAIEGSNAWKQGPGAIIITYDENDYSDTANLVPFVVVKNYGNSVVSNVPYDHYSTLRTLEASFGLPCLNHACDSTSKVMGDIFNEK